MDTELDFIKTAKGVAAIEAAYWGSVLIWAGLVFLAEALGYLPQIGDAGAWSWAFFGAGMIGLLGSLVRQLSTNLPDPLPWDYIFPAGLMFLGLIGVFPFALVWSWALMAAGVALLGVVVSGLVGIEMHSSRQ